MPWVVLVAAGVLEVGWAVGLAYTRGFTRLVPSVLTVVLMAASMGLLAWAVKSIPVGTAYAVWVGIGAFGTAAFGMVVLGEPVTAPRLLFLLLLIVSVIGLKLTSTS